jgi:hypothetical protein
VFGKLTKRLENAQWINQKLVEKRISLVDQVAPDLNDLYCYFLWIGVWKALSPVDVIERKRRLDRIIHVNRPFLGKTCLTAYEAFMDTLFATFTAPGWDAGLRTTLASKYGDRSANYCGEGEWKSEWNDKFVNNAASRADVQARYSDLMDQLAEQVGVQASSKTQVDSQNP